MSSTCCDPGHRFVGVFFNDKTASRQQGTEIRIHTRDFWTGEKLIFDLSSTKCLIKYLSYLFHNEHRLCFLVEKNEKLNGANILIPNGILGTGEGTSLEFSILATLIL